MTTSAATSSAAASPGGRCDQLLAQTSPQLTPGSTPTLASLEAKTLGDEANAFRFDGQTCLATVKPAQVITLTGVARLRPSLVVDGHETVAGRNLEVRFIGSTVYIYLAEIGARDGGKPWLKASLKNLSAASGLNFGQLLDEVRQFSPGHPSPLLKATKAFHSLGTATVSGQRAFVYQGISRRTAWPTPVRPDPGQADGGQAQAARGHAGERHHLSQPRRCRAGDGDRDLQGDRATDGERQQFHQNLPDRHTSPAAAGDRQSTDRPPRGRST